MDSKSNKEFIWCCDRLVGAGPGDIFRHLAILIIHILHSCDVILVDSAAISIDSPGTNKEQDYEWADLEC